MSVPSTNWSGTNLVATSWSNPSVNSTNYATPSSSLGETVGYNDNISYNSATYYNGIYTFSTVSTNWTS